MSFVVEEPAVVADALVEVDTDVFELDVIDVFEAEVAEDAPGVH